MQVFCEWTIALCLKNSLLANCDEHMAEGFVGQVWKRHGVV